MSGLRLRCFLVLLFSALSLPAGAQSGQSGLADVEVDSASILIHPLVSHGGLRVTVSGPGGFEVVKSFESGENPEIGLPGVDGLYKYELRFSLDISQADRELLMAMRVDGEEVGEVSRFVLTDEQHVQSGSFEVSGGIVNGGDFEEEFTAETPPGEQIEAVLTIGDAVIRNSACIGFDCPDSPLFDDSTLLLMENNTRIKFGDTSDSPFPSNDWEIEANSNLSGGASYLGFNDCGTADNDGGCGSDLVFAVEAGARANALYVESDGDVGLGTANPVVDLHIITGNTPTIRLDQDGSSGFTAQAWDVAANETNFFIRDVTNGSQLPLRIRPGAPTSSIDIAANGDVGIGTTTPQSSVHVRRSDGTANVLVEEVNGTTGPRDLFEIRNNGNPEFRLTNTGNNNSWTFSAGTRFVVKNNAGDWVSRITDTGDMEITGVLSELSDVNAKTGIVPVDAEAVLEKVVQLPITEWAYKATPDSRHIGPMAQDFHAAFQTGTTDTKLATMDVGGVAIASIQALEARNRELEVKNAELEKRLELLEAAIANQFLKTAQN